MTKRPQADTSEEADAGVQRDRKWVPFDAARREAFLELIRKGAPSHRDACGSLGLNRSTLGKWIVRGKKLPTYEADAQYRAFYLELQSAEAMRDGLVDRVLNQAAKSDWRAADALGKRQERRDHRRDIKEVDRLSAELSEADEEIARLQAELAKHQVTEPPAGDPPDSASGSITSSPIGADRRAAYAPGKRRERVAVQSDAQRLAKAKADRAEANARYAKTRADKATPATPPARTAVAFPEGFIDACEPDERAVINAAMVRLGYRAATPDDLRAAAESITMEEVEESEAMAARFSDLAKPRGGR